MIPPGRGAAYHLLGREGKKTHTGTESTYGRVDIPIDEMATSVDVSNKLVEDSAVDVAAEVTFDLDGRVRLARTSTESRQIGSASCTFAIPHAGDGRGAIDRNCGDSPSNRITCSNSAACWSYGFVLPRARAEHPAI